MTGKAEQSHFKVWRKKRELCFTVAAPLFPRSDSSVSAGRRPQPPLSCVLPELWPMHVTNRRGIRRVLSGPFLDILRHKLAFSLPRSPSHLPQVHFAIQQHMATKKCRVSSSPSSQDCRTLRFLPEPYLTTAPLLFLTLRGSPPFLKPSLSVPRVRTGLWLMGWDGDTLCSLCLWSS